MDIVTKPKPANKPLVMVLFFIVVMALTGLAITGYRHWHASLPAWVGDPDGPATADDYSDVKEGMVDYRYGVLPDDEKDEQIIGYCAALIPDIRAAMADGKLTNLEAHNLRVKAVQLEATYQYTQTKNSALATVGKPAIEVPECKDGSSLFKDAD